jgi:hypothetical protein
VILKGVGCSLNKEKEMHIIYEKGPFRVVSLGSPYDYAFDIVVQSLDINGEWDDLKGFHSISDDYAITNAREYLNCEYKKFLALVLPEDVR